MPVAWLVSCMPEAAVSGAHEQCTEACTQCSDANWSPAVTTTLLAQASRSPEALLLLNHQGRTTSMHGVNALVLECCTHSSPSWNLVLRNPGPERSAVPAADE